MPRAGNRAKLKPICHKFILILRFVFPRIPGRRYSSPSLLFFTSACTHVQTRHMQRSSKNRRSHHVDYSSTLLPAWYLRAGRRFARRKHFCRKSHAMCNIGQVGEGRYSCRDTTDSRALDGTNIHRVCRAESRHAWTSIPDRFGARHQKVLSRDPTLHGRVREDRLISIVLLISVPHLVRLFYRYDIRYIGNSDDYVSFSLLPIGNSWKAFDFVLKLWFHLDRFSFKSYF